VPQDDLNYATSSDTVTARVSSPVKDIDQPIPHHADTIYLDSAIRKISCTDYSTHVSALRSGALSMLGASPHPLTS